MSNTQVVEILIKVFKGCQVKMKITIWYYTALYYLVTFQLKYSNLPTLFCSKVPLEVLKISCLFFIWNTLLYSMLCCFQNSPYQAERVKVQLYYECLCPDCRNFDTKQFKQTVLALGPYLDINLYPYGNAQVTISFIMKIKNCICL